MEVLKYFRSPKNNALVLVGRNTMGRYDAELLEVTLYMSSFRLGAGSAAKDTLADTVAYVYEYLPDVQELESLGDWPLWIYYDEEDEQPIVVVEKEIYRKMIPEYSQILAKDVPVGTHLLRKAQGFFRFWLGPDAVQNQKLVKNQE